MDLNIIEYHPQAVLESFREGDFDSIEIIGEADEREFFELCFKEKILENLADTMPSMRKKEEVPRWFILAGNMSLKLHQENSFSAFERVTQCGGLLSAMDPSVASKHLDPQTKQILIECAGFNKKNHYPRQAPCDQDTLRKALKDVPAEQWMSWFNEQVQQTFQSHGFFDPKGIFIGDGSHLFVPDNPAYEGSVVMWFDEHNHPVEYDKLTPDERKKAHRERCYKLVSLLHLRGDSFVYAGLALLPGNAHESPVLYRMVEKFVQTVGQGVMKLLILDRGFIDGANLGRCKTRWGIDVLIPMKKKMDIWTDAWDLGKTEPWHSIAPEKPIPKRQPADRPETIRKREEKRQKTLANRRAAPDPAKVLERTEYCSIRGFNSWKEAVVPIHVTLMREVFADSHTSEWALMSTRPYDQPQQAQEDYRLRTQIEERHRLLKCFYDLTDFSSRTFSAIAAQVVMVLLSYSLRQWQLWKIQQQKLAAKTPELMRRSLNIKKEYVVIYKGHAYTQMPLVTFSRELLELEGEARLKALSKIKELEKSMLNWHEGFS